MGIGDYSATDADNVTVPGSPPIEIGEGIGGGPTAHHTLRLAIQRIMADLKTLNGTIAGADGFDGTSAGLKYDFNNSTSVADPGTGKFALNNASPGSTTFISVDALTAAATNPDASDWVAAWDDGNGAIKGLVVITEIGAEQKFAIFKATAVVDNTNWLRVAVTHVASNGTFTNDVTCAIAFSPAGADGGDGDDGTDGNTILNGSGAPGGGTGSDGDFYIDTSGNNIYGPKASGAWGSATSIVGAPGDGSGDMVKSTYDTNDNGKVDAADTADVAPWAGLTGVPASFTPSSHNHTTSDVTDFNTSADARISNAVGSSVQAHDATLVSLAGLSLAAGDILYATAADTLVKLAKGTALQTLRMNSGATAPEWAAASGGGGNSLLSPLGSWSDVVSTTTLTAVTSIDLTGIGTDWDVLELFLDGAESGTANLRVDGRLSTDNGSTFHADSDSYLRSANLDEDHFTIYDGNAWDDGVVLDAVTYIVKQGTNYFILSDGVTGGGTIDPDGAWSLSVRLLSGAGDVAAFDEGAAVNALQFFCAGSNSFTTTGTYRLRKASYA